MHLVVLLGQLLYCVFGKNLNSDANFLFRVDYKNLGYYTLFTKNSMYMKHYLQKIQCI